MTLNLSFEERIALDEQLVRQYFPQFRLRGTLPRDFIGSHRGLELTLQLSVGYPAIKPDLIVSSPRILIGFDGVNLNRLGPNHTFHIYGTNSEGYVRICFSDTWHEGMSAVGVLLRGLLWCEAFCAHQRTGRSIDDCLNAGKTGYGSSTPPAFDTEPFQPLASPPVVDPPGDGESFSHYLSERPVLNKIPPAPAPPPLPDIIDPPLPRPYLPERPLPDIVDPPHPRPMLPELPLPDIIDPPVARPYLPKRPLPDIIDPPVTRPYLPERPLPDIVDPPLPQPDLTERPLTKFKSDCTKYPIRRIPNSVPRIP
ncbi:MAG: hypothetical protein WD534_15165 [Phycisphaeraceae bacterium]